MASGTLDASEWVHGRPPARYSRGRGRRRGIHVSQWRRREAIGSNVLKIARYEPLS